MIRPGTTPITGVSPSRAFTEKSAGASLRLFTLPSPTGAIVARSANSASSTSRPPVRTCFTEQAARFSTNTISARLPGPMKPRSNSPKFRAAESEAMR